MTWISNKNIRISWLYNFTISTITTMCPKYDSKTPFLTDKFQSIYTPGVVLGIRRLSFYRA